MEGILNHTHTHSGTHSSLPLLDHLLQQLGSLSFQLEWAKGKHLFPSSLCFTPIRWQLCPFSIMAIVRGPISPTLELCLPDQGEGTASHCCQPRRCLPSVSLTLTTLL